MPTILDVLHGLGPLTTVRRLDRDDLACLAGVLPAALPQTHGFPDLQHPFDPWAG